MNHRYRKKPIVIEAFQMTEERGSDNSEWPVWLLEALPTRERAGVMFKCNEGTFEIHTLEGDHSVTWDDWIIQGVKGELYPCKPDIFGQTYEPADTLKVEATD